MSFNVWVIPFFGPTGTKDELTISIYVNQPLTFFWYLILTHTSNRKLHQQTWMTPFYVVYSHAENCFFLAVVLCQDFFDVAKKSEKMAVVKDPFPYGSVVCWAEFRCFFIIDL